MIFEWFIGLLARRYMTRALAGANASRALGTDGSFSRFHDPRG
jgi:hypothetical protein